MGHGEAEMKDSFENLVLNIRKCRKECPWMKMQTLEKHSNELFDELNEVVQAIRNNDPENLKEELGDLLHDVLCLVEFASEKFGFTAKDVMDGVTKKMVRRKPWVFGNEKAETPEAAVKRWNEIKKLEKEGKI